MSTLAATVEGIGFWSNGLPDWNAARAFVRDGTQPEAAPARPSPQLLAPNERRRAPDTVAVALEVALAACNDAGRDPRALPSVFASTHGDLGITDYMCATLAADPRSISPTRFHNSVHNAAAGYWTIGAGCTQATTAISAHAASFAEGLVEALVQLAAGEEAVLLVGYDGSSSGPLSPISPSAGLLGGALVLSRAAKPDAPRIEVRVQQGDTPAATTRLSGLAGTNAMAPMLPLFEALAGTASDVRLFAGNGRTLQVDIAHG
ncbi:beta-ketoacyl synthase chain length factor [Lysobacter sp. A6]|uniref:Beta-ketoacyl synthase chain length factor n=1 Tax=Noviluteimonas lactosilytica TaxID=2888523 RepID=A0ABS8JHN0_9GAMM|nr:beta-ketoacyl synthase chain length factor [Lysobacter lactosilyticus]MCC8362983.1 beta-ketoacyl synthase chain length factor [Lysobacter lactosilyticus]